MERDLVHDIRLFGHRGSSALLPENTIPAFHQALADGANAIELDLRRTRDGHFVVCHDASGRRMAGEDHLVSGSTLAEIRRWDAGAGFVDPNGQRSQARQGISIPTFSEVLDALPDTQLTIDLKPDSPDLVAPLLELIAAHNAEARVTVASFHDRLVLRARRLGYPGRTALTRREVATLHFLPYALAGRRVHGQAAQVPVHTRIIRLDGRRFASRCRRLGIRLDYWVVNDPDQAQALLELGATGIMSDDPARIFPVMNAAMTLPLP